MKKKLWLVGQYRLGHRFVFQGIFSTKKKAIAACKNWRYWIVPVLIDKQLPDESISMSGSYYPIQRVGKINTKEEV